MQSIRSHTSKLTSTSHQRQTRAIVNLQQLSQSPWHHSYQDTQTIIIPSTITEQKLNTNTHQSAELPLNPVKHYESPIRRVKQQLQRSGDRPRPNTIQHASLQGQQGEGQDRFSKHKKIQPLTALNFYDDTRKSYNTFDDRSRLNQEIELFASRIRHQSKLIKSIEITRARSTGLKQPNTTSVGFKTNIAKQSFFYKQFKNFLYSSFKVAGKPVQIKRDKYSIESHGLPKKKSIYSFKQKHQPYEQKFNIASDFFAFTKTDVLRKHVGRYDMEGENQEGKDNITGGNTNNHRKSNNNRSRYSSLMQEDSIFGGTVSLHARGNDRELRKKLKGKLFLGRPPTSLVCQEG